MRSDPLRVAGWCVVMMACVLFVAEMGRLSEVPPTVPAPTTGTTNTQLVVSEHYVGNTNTHRFHRATCRYAGCKNCTARFNTRKEAIEAGFRPGGCCDP
jgi:hypothetical protein